VGSSAPSSVEGNVLRPCYNRSREALPRSSILLITVITRIYTDEGKTFNHRGHRVSQGPPSNPLSL